MSTQFQHLNWISLMYGNAWTNNQLYSGVIGHDAGHTRTLCLNTLKPVTFIISKRLRFNMLPTSITVETFWRINTHHRNHLQK